LHVKEEMERDILITQEQIQQEAEAMRQILKDSMEKDQQILYIKEEDPIQLAITRNTSMCLEPSF